mmetsp:Transcript_3148/g.5852  ORF Transcript_3148/g.5852 Transcript_3148/m.5852 type:complete len:220 (+) Transcript_3148:2829-3488(+)
MNICIFYKFSSINLLFHFFHGGKVVMYTIYFSFTRFTGSVRYRETKLIRWKYFHENTNKRPLSCSRRSSDNKWSRFFFIILCCNIICSIYNLIVAVSIICNHNCNFLVVNICVLLWRFDQITFIVSAMDHLNCVVVINSFGSIHIRIFIVCRIDDIIICLGRRGTNGIINRSLCWDHSVWNNCKLFIIIAFVIIRLLAGWFLIAALACFLAHSVHYVYL